MFVREAAINLLIHQDFGDHTRVPVIRFFRDQSQFFNPGDAFATREQLIDPGDEEVNPTIVSAFRRIGLSDQGGTGVGAIFAGSRKLGYMPPVIDNNKADKTFRLRLPKERLLTEEQVLLQAGLGVNLSDHEAAVLAFLTRKGQIDMADVKGLTGLNGPGAVALVQRLTAQVLVEPAQEGAATCSLWRSICGIACRPLAGLKPGQPTAAGSLYKSLNKLPEARLNKCPHLFS